MDDLVHFRMVKNDNGGYLLTVTFSNHDFNMADESAGRQIIEKYGKVITKFSNISIVIDTRKMKSVTPGLGWNLVQDLIKLNDTARKNVNKVAILMINKTIKKYVIDPLLCVYDFVVPTKFFEHNDPAIAFVRN
ncbi:MAG: hypothetical protein S4CHLAM20_14710 [Chlamydiia bacterium]|nr:hypothetical protein [Chlamydiia bacterium]